MGLAERVTHRRDHLKQSGSIRDKDLEEVGRFRDFPGGGEETRFWPRGAAPDRDRMAGAPKRSRHPATNDSKPDDPDGCPGRLLHRGREAQGALLCRSGSCGGGSWEVRLDLGRLTELLHDSLEDLAALLGLKELENLGLGLGKGSGAGRLLVGHLDDMIAELGLDRGSADGADFLGEGGVGKLGDHLLLGEVAEITTTLSGSWLLGEFTRELTEVLPLVGADDRSFGLVLGSLQLFGGGSLRRADENVAGADEVGVGEFLGVGVVELLGVVVGHGVLALDLGLHPLALADRLGEIRGEFLGGEAGLLHLVLENLLGGELGLDLGELGVDISLLDLDAGGGLVDELFHDHAVEDLAIALELLIGGERGGVGAAGVEGLAEVFLEVSLGNLLAVDNGNGILQRDGGGGGLGAAEGCREDQGEDGKETMAHGMWCETSTLHG